MKEDTGMASGAYDEVKLIGRHIKMLRATKEAQPVGIKRLSEILDVTTSMVRYSLRMLEKDGVIIATPDGAVVSDTRYESFMEEMDRHLAGLIKRIEELREEIP